MATSKPKFKTSLASKSRMDIVKENRLKAKSKKGTLYKTSFKGKFWKSKWGKKARKIALVFAVVFCVVFTLGTLRVMAYLQELNDNLPTPDQVFPNLPIASEIYDRKALEDDGTGTRLYRLFNEYNADTVDITQVPDTVKWAFLAAEDSDFYSHSGFDLGGLIRCGLVYLRNTGTICGGSTVTQQLVKITALTNEVAIERKIKEILLSVKVEELYDKDTILEMYLRVAPFGSNIYGVKTASNFYFGKEPKDLTLSEATLLAAIIQDPIRNSPTLGLNKDEVYCRLSDGAVMNLTDDEVSENDEGVLVDGAGTRVAKGLRVKCRQIYILTQMQQKMGQINDQTRRNYDNPEMDDILTLEMIEEAISDELIYKPPVFDKKAGHFVDYVMEQLTTKNYKNGEEPFTAEELQKGGYKIYTTLDYAVQEIAESYTARAVEENIRYNMNNAAVMTVTPQNGEIIAMSGSKNYYLTNSEGCDDNNQNCKFDPKVNIFRTLQSPGSTNKVAAYYMAYKEGLLFTGSMLPDIPMKFTAPGGSVYEPKNWNGAFNGINTAAMQLRDSRNLPAIAVIEMVGVNNYVENAKAWGYSTYENAQVGQAVVLGGIDVYPDEHLQAFTVFANNGDFVELNPILKIEDQSGETIYEANPQRIPLADQQAVYLINQSLRNLYGFSWDQRELAGKSGTSEDSKDAWFMAWSPDFITLAWGGNNNNDPMDRQNGFPPIIINPWLNRYMRDIGEASYFSAKTPFTRPGFVYEGGGDCNSEGACQGISRGWMIQDRTPSPDVFKGKFMVCSDQEDRLARPIDIALGFGVEKEFEYYKMPVASLQQYLDEYLSKDNKRNVMPTEDCTIDRSGGVNGPIFNFSSVTTSGTSSINIKGGIFTTTQGGSITAATFYLNNQVIPSCNTSNYQGLNLTCNINSLNLDNGTYQFRAVATDSAGITNNSSSINVIVGSETNSNMVFMNLPPGTALPFIPYNIDIRYNLASLTNVRLHQVKTVGGNTTTTVVGNMNPIGGNTYRYAWQAPNESASYRFFVTADIVSSTGKLKSNTSNQVNVN